MKLCMHLYVISDHVMTDHAVETPPSQSSGPHSRGDFKSIKLN